MKLPLSFYTRDDVVQIARDLVGKKLVTSVNGLHTSGTIVETEAYQGSTDKACHAFPDVRTTRTEPMYQEGGRAYVYLCYGIHHLFNVVTNVKGKADAVLIRAIEPLEGENVMFERRNFKGKRDRIGAGPGNVGRAMGIHTGMTNISLSGDTLWIEDRGLTPELVSAKRVGVDYAEEAALWPWRFYAKNNTFISRK